MNAFVVLLNVLAGVAETDPSGAPGNICHSPYVSCIEEEHKPVGHCLRELQRCEEAEAAKARERKNSPGKPHGETPTTPPTGEIEGRHSSLP
jgi:hypothetical protein